jgi:HAMP domain-containing protein
VLSIVAGGCVWLLTAGPADRLASGEVGDQRDLAADVATSIGSSATSRARSLTALAAPYQSGSGDPAALVPIVASDHVRWTGAALVSGPAHTVTLRSGERIPVGQLPRTLGGGTTLYSAVLPAGPRILTVVPLRGGVSLVAASIVRLRTLHLDPAQQQSVMVTVSDGTIVKRQGPAPPPTDRSLLRYSAGQARAGRTGTASGPAGRRGGERDSSVTLMAYQPVVAGTGVGNGLRFGVVTSIRSPRSAAPDRTPALVAGASLAGIAVLATLVLLVGLARPVRRLRDRAVAVASGTPSPDPGRSWLAEVDRVHAALRQTGRRFAGHRRVSRLPAPGRGTVPALWVPVVACALLLVWAAGTVTLLGTGPVRVPSHALVDTQDRVSRGVDALNRSLDAGITDLRAVASAGDLNDLSDIHARLHDLYRHTHRYRSLYLADGDGEPLTSYGDAPLGAGLRLPGADGVYQGNTSGRIPMVYAVVHPGNGTALVAEFAIPFLEELLDNTGSTRVYVLDAGLRTVLDTHGYVAFSRPSDPAILAAARAAATGRGTADIQTVGGSRTVLAADRLLPTGATKHLGWVLIDERPVSELDLPDNTRHHRATLLGLAVIGLAALLFAAYYAGTVRPLRVLAGAADGLADGDLRTVIYPLRHDEVGAVAICLDICRQAAVRGSDALGGVFRVRQGDADTGVIPAIDDTTIPVTVPAARRPGTGEPAGELVDIVRYRGRGEAP